MARTWAVLIQAARSFPEDPDIQRWSARGAVSLIVFCGQHQKWDEMARAWHALCQAARNLTADREVQLWLARGAVNAVNRYGEHHKWDEMALAWHELSEVAAKFPHDPEIQLRLMEAARLQRRPSRAMRPPIVAVALAAWFLTSLLWYLLRRARRLKGERVGREPGSEP